MQTNRVQCLGNRLALATNAFLNNPIGKNKDLMRIALKEYNDYMRVTSL